jgi:ribosomal protein S27AE
MIGKRIANPSNSEPAAKHHPRPQPQASEESCPFCGAVALTDRIGARFRFACGRCGLLYELTAAAHRRLTLLPPALVARIRLENAHGRAPCISAPDLESFPDSRLSGTVAVSGRERSELAQKASAAPLG